MSGSGVKKIRKYGYSGVVSFASTAYLPVWPNSSSNIESSVIYFTKRDTSGSLAIRK